MLHSTRHLPVPGCKECSINNMSTKYAKHTNDQCSLRIRATFGSEAWELWSHPWPGNEVAIGCAAMYCNRTANAFSVGIRCRHCMQVLCGILLYTIHACQMHSIKIHACTLLACLAFHLCWLTANMHSTSMYLI